MLIDIPCLLMRGGTSKGPYFLAQDLPRGTASFAIACCSRSWVSPHVRQIDGIGGGDSLTSKVVIVGPFDASRHRHRVPVRAGRSRQGRGRHRAQLRQHVGRRGSVRDRARPRRGRAIR